MSETLSFTHTWVQGALAAAAVVGGVVMYRRILALEARMDTQDQKNQDFESKIATLEKLT